MDQENLQHANEKDEEVRQLIRQTLEEFVRAQQHRSEPSYKSELVEERKRSARGLAGARRRHKHSA